MKLRKHKHRPVVSPWMAYTKGVRKQRFIFPHGVGHLNFVSGQKRVLVLMPASSRLCRP